MKKNLKIISTNWIHLVGFYITAFLSLILFQIIGLESSEGGFEQILMMPISTILLFLLYGLPVIAGFYGAIILADIVGFSLTKTKLKQLLIFEWVIIILPFINWAIEYKYWLWLTLAISFLITQMIRKSKIERIIKNAA